MKMKAHLLDGLAAFGSAMSAARRSFAVHPVESAATIRRLARVIVGLSDNFESPELVGICAQMAQSQDADLPALVNTLVGVVRGLCITLSGDRAVVLIVDDEPVISHILNARLQSPTREIVIAPTAAKALEIVQNRLIALIILDLGLPDRDGRDLMAELRLNVATTAPPIIVLSAHDDARVKSECFALGADEYFEKPVEIDLLTTVVSAKLQRVAEISRKLGHDPLTKVLNRLSFTETFVRNQAFMSRTGGDLSIAILDLDHFKSVNDTHGHAMGDEVLRRTAAALGESLRASDIFGRWGGEEFVVLFPGTNCKGAAKALENVAGALRKIEFPGTDGQPFQVTFSAGVAMVAAGTNVDAAVSAADVLLYRARAQGRNRVISQSDDA